MPLDLRAQQPAVPVVGFLRDTLPDSELVAGLGAGLNESGFHEGQSVSLDYRWAEGQGIGLSVLASDLIRRRVAVLVAGGDHAIHAAMSSTVTTPIIFASGEDPIKAGYVGNLNGPDGNLTGVSFYSGSGLVAKQLRLIDEVIPTATEVALLANPNNPNTELNLREIVTASNSLGVKLRVLNASEESEFGLVFARLLQMHVDVLRGRKS